MELRFTITGRCCDLALHPVSPATADKIKELGREFYATKYMNWWRNGNTCTCGMKFDQDARIEVFLDGKPVDFEGSVIGHSAETLRRRMYLNSKAKFLCLLGYDNEESSLTWVWSNVQAYDPSMFDFFVQRWDRIMGAQDFLVVDEVRYNGSFANDHQWGKRGSFTLVDPTVIDLDALRHEVEAEAAPRKRPARKQTPGKAAVSAQAVAA